MARPVPGPHKMRDLVILARNGTEGWYFLQKSGWLVCNMTQEVCDVIMALYIEPQKESSNSRKQQMVVGKYTTDNRPHTSALYAHCTLSSSGCNTVGRSGNEGAGQLASKTSGREKRHARSEGVRVHM